VDEATREAGRRGWRRIGAGRCWCGRPLRAALLGARPAPSRAVHPTHAARGHTPRRPRPARRRAGRPRVRSPAGSARSPRAGCSAGTPDAGRRVEDAQPQLSLSAPSPLKFPVSASPTARVSFRAAAARVLPSADDSDACPTAARATSASYIEPPVTPRSARNGRQVTGDARHEDPAARIPQQGGRVPGSEADAREASQHGVGLRNCVPAQHDVAAAPPARHLGVVGVAPREERDGDTGVERQGPRHRRTASMRRKRSSSVSTGASWPFSTSTSATRWPSSSTSRAVRPPGTTVSPAP